MNTKELEKELSPKKDEPTTIIKNENGERKEVSFLGVLLNLDKLTGNDE